jgi:hypothetical protein
MNHPYTEFESHPLWSVVDSELSELEENQDIQITTAREYVVGSLVKACVKGLSEIPHQET